MAGEPFRPYVSAGLGVARHDGELSAAGISSSDKDTVFAYQVGAGLGYDVTDNVNIFGGYRYLGSSDATLDTLEAEYDAHELRVGVRYAF